MTFIRYTTEERVAAFWAKVDKRGPDECWPWIAGTDSGGYGKFLSAAAPRVYSGAHRFAYELLVGKVPDGLTLDHLCHGRDETCGGGPTCPHRRCVNPAHLEPVDERTNILRGKSLQAQNKVKTHCIHGHEFTPENTCIRKDGGRMCWTCVDERSDRRPRKTARRLRRWRPSR